VTCDWTGGIEGVTGCIDDGTGNRVCLRVVGRRVKDTGNGVCPGWLCSGIEGVVV